MIGKWNEIGIKTQSLKWNDNKKGTPMHTIAAMHTKFVLRFVMQKKDSNEAECTMYMDWIRSQWNFLQRNFRQNQIFNNNVWMHGYLDNNAYIGPVEAGTSLILIAIRNSNEAAKKELCIQGSSKPSNVSQQSCHTRMPDRKSKDNAKTMYKRTQKISDRKNKRACFRSMPWRSLYFVSTDANVQSEIQI